MHRTRKLTILMALLLAAGVGCESDTTADDPAQPAPAPPQIVSFTASVATLTEGEAVTFTATVSDVNGVEDVVTGTLRSDATDLALGTFEESLRLAETAAEYTVTLTWAALNALEPITFEGSEHLFFRAVFEDGAGGSVDATESIVLTCAGGAACAGSCTDLSVDATHCGACDHACGAGQVCVASKCTVP